MPRWPFTTLVLTSSDSWAASFSPDPPWLLGNLILRKQLALYQQRQVRPRRATDATRLTMVLAARLFDWKGALISVRAMGVRILKTPFRSPQANSHCERLIGSLRRGCLDFLIPLSESHLRRMVKDWQIHYDQAHPHSSLGPGLPEASPGFPVPLQEQRHQILAGYQVRAKSILGGLHHEYQQEKIAV